MAMKSKSGFAPGTAPTTGGKGPTAPRRSMPGAPPTKPPVAQSSPGTIRNYGGDAHSYLGHFRSSDNLARGHNRGAPRVAPSFNPVENPIAATRQMNRARVTAAKTSGGDVKAARKENRASMMDAKAARQGRNAMGFKAEDKAAAKTARQTARQETKAARMASKPRGASKMAGGPGGVVGPSAGSAPTISSNFPTPGAPRANAGGATPVSNSPVKQAASGSGGTALAGASNALRAQRSQLAGTMRGSNLSSIV